MWPKKKTDRIFIVKFNSPEQRVVWSFAVSWHLLTLFPGFVFRMAHPNSGRTAFPPRSYTDREQNMTVTRQKNSPAWIRGGFFSTKVFFLPGHPTKKRLHLGISWIGILALHSKPGVLSKMANFFTSINLNQKHEDIEACGYWEFTFVPHREKFFFPNRFDGISLRIPNWLQVLRSLWHFRKGQWPTETRKDGVLEGSKWHEMPILSHLHRSRSGWLEDWLEHCPGLREIMPDNKNTSFRQVLCVFCTLRICRSHWTGSLTPPLEQEKDHLVESCKDAPLAAFNMSMCFQSK